ncbi:MAG: DUF4003 domain-containing protein, partial [Coriobacteriia bacterium]|nr:DUF4003 domain-containing protein [Coriobacteriia bacterium]
GTEKYNFKNIADRAKRFHDGLRGRLWFFAGHDDSIFSVMLGLSDIMPSMGVERIEQLNQQLRPQFKWTSKSNLQALSQVLALGGTSDEALCCLVKLNKALRAQKIRLDREYTLPALGILSLLSVDSDVLVADIKEARDFLRTQKGLRSVSAQELLLFATAIISSVYAKECTEQSDEKIAASTSASIINIIIAQQIMAMLVVMAAASVATTAATS